MNELWEDLRHPHREAFDNHMSVEGLQHILRKKTVINARVLVLPELGQLVLSNVYHDEVIPLGQTRYRQ